jgi:phytoene dehydrogenase-like protein
LEFHFNQEVTAIETEKKLGKKCNNHIGYNYAADIIVYADIHTVYDNLAKKLKK